MTDKPEAPERLSLSRWSRRKRAASAAPATPAPSAPTPAVGAPQSPAASPSAPLPGTQLPSIDSLGFDSDFAAFLGPEVDETLKRAALKQLFRDPRFNVMDGLDTYIEDYTKADPIEPDVLADLLRRGFGTIPDADQATADQVPRVKAAADLQRSTAPSLASAPETKSERALPGEAEAGADADPAAARNESAADDHRGGR